MMSLTFGLFTQVSGSGPLGPLVYNGPITITSGALRFAPVSQSVSACPSVCHTLWYRASVFNSNSFHWIFFKPCILVVDIMMMCLWVFDGARINFKRITVF